VTGSLDKSKVTAILLAGGQSRRMGGGDKCLLNLGGKTVLQRVIDRIGPQVAQLALNANGNPDRFGAYGLPVMPDAVGDFAGPLAGVLTGMEWAAAHSSASHVLTVPTDAPFLPRDLAARLIAPVAEGRAEMTCAESDGRAHPVVGLWPVSLREALRSAMLDEDIRKVDRWTARYRLEQVRFETEPLDPFFNMNRPDDAARADELIALEA